MVVDAAAGTIRLGTGPEVSIPGPLGAAERTVALTHEGDGVYGDLDRALESFDHEHLAREQKWDLLQSDWIGAHLDAIEPGWLRDASCEVHEWFIERRQDLRALRQGVVHNDANDHNVLLGGAEVVGLIDFGDLCRTALVSEPAIAASYLAMRAHDPLAAVDAVTRGYHRALPLRDDEVQAILPLVDTRRRVIAREGLSGLIHDAYGNILIVTGFLQGM